MKIAVNAQLLSRPLQGGIANYVLNICKHLLVQGSLHEFHFISDGVLAKEFLVPADRTHVYQGRFGFSSLGSFLFSRYQFSQAFSKLQCDLAFVPWESPCAVSPAVITVHDLIPLRSITQSVDAFHQRLLTKIKFSLFARRYAQHAALLIADSHDTKYAIQDLCRIPEEKIRVVPLGVDREDFYARSEEEVERTKKKYGIEGPYWINVASEWQPRKNLENLLRAFGLCARHYSDIQLVITGKKGPSYSSMVHIIKEMGLQHRVHLLEFVPHSALPSLLSGALALVFPSFHEGFGLPVVEAMSCGCPVICSYAGALSEVGGDAVEYIDPFDVDAIEEAMRRLAGDEQKRANLRSLGLERAREFSWEKAAERTLQAFEDARAMALKM